MGIYAAIADYMVKSDLVIGICESGTLYHPEYPQAVRRSDAAFKAVMGYYGTKF